MREIDLYEVGMENYGPYIDPMILPFKNDNITLLTGPNGVGKTMALDAIPFTLFGITSKGLKGDDVINNVVEKNCYTWVKFILNSDKYFVKRYQGYSKFGGNNVVLNKNGVDIKSGSKEVIPEIERLWCSQRSFMNTLMFGQKVKDFFTDLTDSKQKEIFRKLLGLDNYVDYYKQADSVMKIIFKALQDWIQEIAVNQGLIGETNDRIEELKKVKVQYEVDKLNRMKELDRSLAQCNRIIRVWKDNISKLKLKEFDSSTIQIKIASLQKSFDNTQKEKEREEDELKTKKELKKYELSSQASKKNKEFIDKYNKLKDEKAVKWRKDETKIDKYIKILIEDKHRLELNTQVVEGSKNQVLTFIDKINKSVFEAEISSCPVCLQEITEDVKTHLEGEIKKSKTDIADYNESIKILNNDILILDLKITDERKKKNTINITYDVEFKALKKTYEEYIENIKNRLEDVLKKVENAATEQLKILQTKTAEHIEQLTKTIKECQEKKLEIDEVKEEIDSAEESLKGAENGEVFVLREIKQLEEDEYDETQLNGYKGRVIEFQKEIDSIIKISSEAKRRYDINEFWKAAYSPTGIPSTLIDEAIPFMNKRVGEYLDQMSNGRYIVSFDTQDTIKSGEMRDKISVRVLDTHTRANKRKQLSGGQTRLVDIATVLTLGDLQSKNLGMKVNLLIFDEIFDSLDIQNIDYVSKVLTRLKKGKSIYLISHTHQDQLEADEVLEFKA